VIGSLGIKVIRANHLFALDSRDNHRMRLIAFTLFSALLVSAAPCINAGPSCTEWLSLGGGAARSLIYRTYSLETRNENITRALVVVHGAGRDADNYFRNVLAAAFLADALENTVVIAPRMASAAASCHDTLASHEISWNCNTWRSGGPAISDPDVTSFDFLDEILRKVARKDIFPNLKQIVVSGHSAGGQVVNRYEMANRVHDKLGIPVTYVVANPSSYAWPDSTRPTETAYSVQAHAPGYIPEVGPDAAPFRNFGGARDCTTYDLWPYGMKNRTGYTAKQTDEELKTQLISRPTTYLLGELDVLPLGGFDGSCSAMAQGPTRLARGEAFGKFVNEKMGAHHAVKIVPECGHNARCMFTSEDALPLLFPK
jgi:pimeloyl-ACP methyl ester carboxylesterase